MVNQQEPRRFPSVARRRSSVLAGLAAAVLLGGTLVWLADRGPAAAGAELDVEDIGAWGWYGSKDVGDRFTGARTSFATLRGMISSRMASSSAARNTACASCAVRSTTPSAVSAARNCRTSRAPSWPRRFRSSFGTRYFAIRSRY